MVLLDSPNDLNPSDERPKPKVLSLGFMLRMLVYGTEGIFEVLLPSPNYRISQGQQLPSHTEDHVDGVLLFPPKSPNSLSEFLLLHGLTKLLPHPGFCLSDHLSQR